MWLQALEIVDRLSGLRGGCKDRPAVRLHQVEPLHEILRMVGPHILRDAKLGAECGSDDLGDQLLGAISLVTEPFAELAVASVLV